MKTERNEKEKKARHEWLLVAYVNIGIGFLLLLVLSIGAKYIEGGSWAGVVGGLAFYSAVAILGLLEGLRMHRKGERFPSWAYDEEKLPLPPEGNKEK